MNFIRTTRIITTLCLATIISFNHAAVQSKIAIIGTGYVGLVSGPGLAEFGNTVICADIDKEKIAALHRGEIPIYEPGLKELVDRHVASANGTGRLSFTDNVQGAIDEAEIIFIAVGTPMGDDGTADLKFVKSVTDMINPTLAAPKIICTKSTVPVGTGAWIRSLLEARGIDSKSFSIVSNPEFLREGCAVNDFLYGDRVVIGAENDAALQTMCAVYQQPFDNGMKHVLTNVTSSEMIKYASNGFLAVKISYANELANLCDATGADAKVVTYAMGLDTRIGGLFLNPGPGFGGSCFPKDSQALLRIAEDHDVDLYCVQASLTANEQQKEIAAEKLLELMNNDVAGKTIAILGLAFKANTDDIRYSPAITTIKELLSRDALIKAYDPAAMNNMKKYHFPDITYCQSAYEAITGADAIIVLTEWQEFKDLDWATVSTLVKSKILVDMRNIVEPALLNSLGFTWDDIGRSCFIINA
jgi:UDPglucose 6-dehydrogenase